MSIDCPGHGDWNISTQDASVFQLDVHENATNEERGKIAAANFVFRVSSKLDEIFSASKPKISKINTSISITGKGVSETLQREKVHSILRNFQESNLEHRSGSWIGEELKICVNYITTVSRNYDFIRKLDKILQKVNNCPWGYIYDLDGKFYIIGRDYSVKELTEVKKDTGKKRRWTRIMI